MAIVLCDDDSKALFTTERTPAEIKCSVRRDIGDRGSSIVKLADGSVEVSSFPMGSANGRPITALIVHDLSFIDRRQSSARNYVLAVAGVAASVLALFLGFVFWLLIRRWINELVGDIRGRRFLDDARSEPGSRPLLTQIRRVLREVETTQRLEIDFHENWTPQALQQVVRDHLGAPEVFIVSNREPYIHNASPTAPWYRFRRAAWSRRSSPSCAPARAPGSRTAAARRIGRWSILTTGYASRPRIPATHCVASGSARRKSKASTTASRMKGSGRCAIWRTCARPSAKRIGSSIRP